MKAYMIDRVMIAANNEIEAVGYYCQHCCAQGMKIDYHYKVTTMNRQVSKLGVLWDDRI